MKKLLIFGLIFSLLLLPLALAVPVPYPIAIKLTPAMINARVDVMDVTKGITNTYYTNKYGEVILDASEFAGFSSTDTFKATVILCQASSNCVKEAILGTDIFFQFDLSSLGYTCPDCIDSVCGGGGVIGGGCTETFCKEKYCDITCPEDTTPYESCKSCCTEKECKDTVCPVCPDCPPCECSDTTTTALVAGIIALIVGILAGNFGKIVDREKAQLQKYLKTWTELEPGEKINIIMKKNKDGELEVDGRSHGHKGHENLHSIWTEHRTYKHPRGIMNPNFDKNGNYIGEGKI